ncbi:hypothetical protein OFC87_28345, partial [Escherichia coli]|nr:hypothetical protein [Escherichia coli]
LINGRQTERKKPAKNFLCGRKKGTKLGVYSFWRWSNVHIKLTIGLVKGLPPARPTELKLTLL